MSGESVQNRGWWASNWKWVVPVGCFGLLVLMVAGCGAFFFGTLSLVTGAIKSTEVFQEGMTLARSHPEVIAPWSVVTR